MTPTLATDPSLWPAVLRLLQEAFAYMEGRIDPPSSLRDLTPEALTRQAEVGEIWVIGAPLACVFLTPKPGRCMWASLPLPMRTGATVWLGG